MAKFARVTYGLRGDTEEYIYVVNDNVRAGDVLQPSVKHYVSGKIYGTTGIAQKVNKTLTSEEYGKLKENNAGFPSAIGTGKDFGITGGRGSNTGTIVKDKEANRFKSENPDNFNPNNSFVKDVRDKNVELREKEQEERGLGRFESEYDRYSKPFMNNEGDK